MADKNLKVIVSTGVEETPSESISDSLYLEVGPTRFMRPGGESMFKITVRNGDQTGRMAHLSATYDQSKLSVRFSSNLVYVGPQCATPVYAIVRSFAASGNYNIKFTVR